jgi:hypothetical protein
VEVRGWSERVWSLLGLQYWGVVLVWQHEGVGLVDLARCPHGEQISASTVHKCAGVTSRCCYAGCALLMRAPCTVMVAQCQSGIGWVTLDSYKISRFKSWVSEPQQTQLLIVFRVNTPSCHQLLCL